MHLFFFFIFAAAAAAVVGAMPVVLIDEDVTQARVLLAALTVAPDIPAAWISFLGYVPPFDVSARGEAILVRHFERLMRLPLVDAGDKPCGAYAQAAVTALGTMARAEIDGITRASFDPSSANMTALAHTHYRQQCDSQGLPALDPLALADLNFIASRSFIMAQASA